MALGLPLTCGPAASEAIEGTHGRSRVAVPASGGSAHTPPCSYAFGPCIFGGQARRPDTPRGDGRGPDRRQ